MNSATMVGVICEESIEARSASRLEAVMRSSSEELSVLSFLFLFLGLAFVSLLEDGLLSSCAIRSGMGRIMEEMSSGLM